MVDWIGHVEDGALRSTLRQLDAMCSSLRALLEHERKSRLALSRELARSQRDSARLLAIEAERRRIVELERDELRGMRVALMQCNALSPEQTRCTRHPWHEDAHNDGAGVVWIGSVEECESAVRARHEGRFVRFPQIGDDDSCEEDDDGDGL